MRAEADAPVASPRGGMRCLFVNGYTGALLGGGSPAVARLLPQCHGLASLAGDVRRPARHRSRHHRRMQFRLPVPRRQRSLPAGGRARWTRQRLRNITWFKRGLPGKARDFNWHNTIGFWSAIPLAIIVAAGVVMSYPWANALLYRMVGEDPPVQGRGPGGPGGPGGAARGERGGDGADAGLGLNALWARAEQFDGGWRSISLRMPSSATMPVRSPSTRATAASRSIGPSSR